MGLPGNVLVSEQQDCPHTVVPIRKPEEVAAHTDETRCPLYFEHWFTVNENLLEVSPVIVQHCGHVVCRQCFTAFQVYSIGCPYHGCNAENGTAPLNQRCAECRDWTVNFAMPISTKTVLTVRRDMVGSLKDDLAEIEEDLPGSFQIPYKHRKALLQYWRAVLYDYEAQYHRWNDLAELLDPFRGADVIHEEAKEKFGKALLKPLPQTKAKKRGFLAPDPQLRGQFPFRSEPWISTFIRTWAHNLNEDEDEVQVVNHYELGEINIYHELHRGELVDEEGTWVENWPIKQILRHRFNDDGEIEYWVQYLGFPQPAENEWNRREEIGRACIWQKYDLQHGILLPGDSEDESGESNRSGEPESSGQSEGRDVFKSSDLSEANDLSERSDQSERNDTESEERSDKE